MKKIISLASCSLLLSLAACGSNTEITAIQPVENLQSFAAPANPAKDLIQQMIDKRFTFADKNKDKKLVFNEFKGLESEHEDVMKEMFDSVDTDKNGTVTYQEFVKAETAGISASLKQMFNMMDRNANDLLDAGSELDMTVEVAAGMANDAGNKITQAQVKKDYLSYDTNKDGKLSYVEFQSPEMKYILMAPVDPYKNSTKKAINPVSINRVINSIKTALKK